MKKILITGCAGFIGYHCTKKFLSKQFQVIGIDNLNDYYDVNLKKNRLKNISSKKFIFYKKSLGDKNFLKKLFKKYKFDYVLNLAAQAGVRYSIQNPHTYVQNNIVEFLNLIEISKEYRIKHFVYASSSSVYGLNSNKKIFSTRDPASHPLAVYGASKRSNELLAHSYSYLFNLPTSGLRFFTVYGPWGRPDMALFKFVSSIINNKRIELFNYGNHTRDFTYIDDVVEMTYRAVLKKAKASSKISEMSSKAPWKIYNICSSKPIHLRKFVKIISRNLNKDVKIKNLKMQRGDVEKTFGSNRDTIKQLKYTPKFNINYGIEKFISWYINYLKIKK